MATQVILPALGMSQDTGIIVRWLKAEGEEVAKGEPLAEIETDKATVELEAPASGILAQVSGAAGVEIPVGQVIASIVAPAELPGAPLLPASPKARRLVAEHGQDLASIQGSGPGGAVLAADVQAARAQPAPIPVAEEVIASTGEHLSNTWRIMAERTTQSWTSVPHFYLMREVNASRLITWREQLQKRLAEKVTYTDLLVKVVAAALRAHPRLNASWQAGSITWHDAINIGLAVATEEGLVVPVIQRADELSVQALAQAREDLVAKAQAGKLRPQHIQGGTFTISNLGMYGVDVFNAIINQPQAAILAVGRIAERVVPVAGQPSVQPTLVFSLACDHRVVDGARGAQFVSDLADLVEEPLGLLG
ncbi:MAG TPA: dihydrolipoamide acetyltransferase family protein [Ktedonobacteraceae bacterium]|nr:dihydrolipoamide acetyltransferase family protein [Ktedonobacteraceae bacterium]